MPARWFAMFTGLLKLLTVIGTLKLGNVTMKFASFLPGPQILRLSLLD